MTAEYYPLPLTLAAPPRASAVAYAYSAIVSPQFYCDVATTTCPTIAVPTVHGIVTVDRWTYMTTLYDFNYSTRWTEVGWLFVFLAVFQLCHLAFTQLLRHGEH